MITFHSFVPRPDSAGGTEFHQTAHIPSMGAAVQTLAALGFAPEDNGFVWTSPEGYVLVHTDNTAEEARQLREAYYRELAERREW